MRQDPKPRGDDGEHQAKWFDVEGQFDPGQHLEQDNFVGGAVALVKQDLQHQQKGDDGRAKGQAVAQIRGIAEDQVGENARERNEDRQEYGGAGVHLPPPLMCHRRWACQQARSGGL